VREMTARVEKPTRRIGRPPTELAGEVEARILDAAARVFLERGFDGASIELIAETARAGKPTIYARFPDKEALFEAAVLQRITARNARLGTHRPSGATVQERLTNIGIALVQESLTDDFVGLLRLAIAESRRRPKFASDLLQLCRERGGRLVTHLLVEGLDGLLWSDESDVRALKAGRFFAELVLLPMLLRGLAQQELSGLRSEIEAHVREHAAFFLAALKNGGLDEA
jgi:AcrR family transcriptional regulator